MWKVVEFSRPTTSHQDFLSRRKALMWVEERGGRSSKRWLFIKPSNMKSSTQPEWSWKVWWNVPLLTPQLRFLLSLISLVSPDPHEINSTLGMRTQSLPIANADSKKAQFEILQVIICNFILKLSCQKFCYALQSYLVLTRSLLSCKNK